MKSLLVTAVGALVSILLLVFLDDWQQTLRAEAPLLPVAFSHAVHGGENCLTCHHNFADQTGSGLCLECHRDHAEVSALREEQFHGLCRNCHAERQKAGESHGPLRECGACHAEDVEP